VALVTLLTLWLPFSPLRGMFGFQSLPLPFLLALMPITILYLAASELAKRWFYRRVQW
jgi:Mg2+-importing ATPase